MHTYTITTISTKVWVISLLVSPVPRAILFIYKLQYIRYLVIQVLFGLLIYCNVATFSIQSGSVGSLLKPVKAKRKASMLKILCTTFIVPSMLSKGFKSVHTLHSGIFLFSLPWSEQNENAFYPYSSKSYTANKLLQNRTWLCALPLLKTCQLFRTSPQCLQISKAFKGFEMHRETPICFTWPKENKTSLYQFTCSQLLRSRKLSARVSGTSPPPG